MIVALVVPAPKMSRVRRLWVERPAEVSSNKPDFGMLTSQRKGARGPWPDNEQIQIRFEYTDTNSTGT